MKTSKYRISLILLLIIASCALNNSWVKAQSTPKHKQIHKVWTINRLAVYQQQLYAFTPVISDDIVYFTSKRGLILKVDSNNGKILDKITTNYKFSSGLALSYHTIFVTTENAKLIAINKNSHKILWQDDLPTIAIEAPLVANNIVIVKSNDGQILAFNIDDGKKIWIYNSNPPNLTLYNNCSMAIVNNEFLLSGFANGKIALFNINNGIIFWEQDLSANNINEKLKDINTRPLISNDKIFITNYLGNIYCLDLFHGNILWSKTINGPISSINVNDNDLDVASSDNNILYHFDQNSGKLIWQKTFKKEIVYLTNFDTYLLAVDVKGYIYLIDPSVVGGQVIEDTKIAPSGAVNAVNVNSYNLVLQGQNGEISLIDIY